MRRLRLTIACGVLTVGFLSVGQTACRMLPRLPLDSILKSDEVKGKGYAPHSRRNAAPTYQDPDDTSPITRMTVNGDTVEADELWLGLHEELAARATSLTPEQYRDFVEKRSARLVRDAIAELLLSQRASLRLSPEAEKGLDSLVDAEIRKIITADYDGRQRRYEKHLESLGETLEQVQRKLRREVLISSYLEQKLKPKIVEPTRAELLAQYKAMTDSIRQPNRRRTSLIDVRVIDCLPPDVDRPTREQLETARTEALTRIRAAQTELQNGAYFADVARRYSDGLHAVDGGSWGWVSKGSVRERFEPAIDALFQLRPAEVSEIIEAADSFFLVRCDEIEETIEPDFQTIQPELLAQHRNESYNRLIAELVAKLRQEARIRPANLERFHAAVVEAAASPSRVERQWHRAD